MIGGMKRCPQCNRTYSNETFVFCLDDGTPLDSSDDPEATQRLPRSNDSNSHVVPIKQNIPDKQRAITVVDSPRIYLTRGTRLSDKPHGNEIGPTYVAGTEFEYIRTDENGNLLVKDATGNEKWLNAYDSSTKDERAFFRIRERGIIGYVVGHMFADRSGGSTTSIYIHDSLLGRVEVLAKQIKLIEVKVDGDKTFLVVETLDGNIYTGRVNNHISVRSRI